MNRASNTSLSDSGRRGFFASNDPTSWIVICGTAIIAAMIVGTVFIVAGFRERAIEGSVLELRDVSRLLAQHFDRQFDEILSTENVVASYIERQAPTAAEFAQFASSETIDAMLEDMVSASVDRKSRISLFDQQGNLIISTDSTSAVRRNISDRNYFKALREQNPASRPTLQIGLIDSGNEADKRVVLARRISASDGQMLGAIVRVIPIPDIERFLSSVARKDRTIQLVNDREKVLVGHRDPFADTEQPMFELMRGRSEGRSISSGQRLQRYPVTVVTSTTVAAALADWHDETRTLMLVAILMAAVIGVTLFSIVRQLREQARRLDVALNNMPQALLLFDSSERLIVKNNRYMEMFGASQHALVGRRFREIVRGCQRDSGNEHHLDAYWDSVREALWQESRTQNVMDLADGRSMQVVNQALGEGGWVTTIEDVTERRRAEELTIRLAQYDAPTGLPNRASFIDRLRHEMSSPGRELAVMFVDLDEFKVINDTLGHHVGDQLLSCVAFELKSCLEPNEFVARLGGDEFALLSAGPSSRDSALGLLQRVYEAIRHTHDCGGHSLTIDASIGVALAPSDGATSDCILRSADLAMHAAKTRGKKTFMFFEPEMEASARERVALEAELRKALAEGQIEAHFQPIYDLASRTIVSCEALARWRHPQRGFVPPTTFIPIAERSGLIGQLGDAVLRQACQEAMNWPGELTVAVNVSPLQLRNPLFSLKVISALYDSGLPAGRLEIEITEAVLIDDDEAALKILHELRAIGVRIALDDFGTGYSSLSYLQRFPFDKIKIDRCFVEGLTERDISRGIIKAVITMASELHVITTAEGVETTSQRDALQKLGCHQIQGNLIAPAGPSASIAALLEHPVAHQAQPG